MSIHDERKYPVLDDIPEADIDAFKEWLKGETIPMNDDGSPGYYPYQYTRFKAGLGSIDD